MPRSHVDFVMTHGAFCIDGDLTGRGSGNDTELFSPHRILEQTTRYREMLAKSKDTDSQEILNDGLLFCGDPCNEYFHLFVVSSANEVTGEMATRGYDYQDPGNSDPWHEGDGTFDSVVEEIAQTVRDNAQ